MTRARRIRWATSLFSIAAWSACEGGAALAQSSVEATNAAREASAQALFDEARQLLAAGHVTVACARFQASQRLDPGAGTQLNLASCYEQAGQLASAWGMFRSAGSAARRSARPEWGVIADMRADRLEPLVPRVVVHLADEETMEDVAILIDGHVVATEVLGSKIPLDPGEHHLIAKAAGRVPFERRLSATAGSVETVEIPLLTPIVTQEREAPRPPPAASWERLAGISAAGAGLVGIGLGAYFGVTAVSKNADAARQCPTGRCTSQAPIALTDEARSARTGAIVAFGAGGALAATGIALLVLSAHPPRMMPTAGFDREGWSVGVRGSF